MYKCWVSRCARKVHAQNTLCDRHRNVHSETKCAESLCYGICYSQPNGKYCELHSCRIGGCLEAWNQCLMHIKCAMGCYCPRYMESYYCFNHCCLVDNCLRLKNNCMEHKCDILYCSNRRQINLPHCYEHNCIPDICHNSIFKCNIHKCRVVNCTEKKYNKDYCYDHVCEIDGCMNSNIECEIHRCVVCKVPKYKDYNTCYTHIDEYAPLRGIFPKDIIGIINLYVIYS